MDMTQWSTFDSLYVPGRKGVGFNDQLCNRSRDSMSHVAIVFTGGSTNGNTYSIEISTEWRVIYANDTELASTHTMHSAVPVSLWSSIQKQAQAAEGQLAGNAGKWGRAVSRVLGGALNGLGRNGGRALGLMSRIPRLP